MKKPEESKLKWSDRGLFQSPICFALCRSQKKFDKELKRLGIRKKDRPDFLLSDRADATAHFITANNGSEIVIICLGDVKDRSLTAIYGLLVHEAVHIWQHVKELIGESDPSAEFEAYSIQNLAQKLMEDYTET